MRQRKRRQAPEKSRTFFVGRNLIELDDNEIARNFVEINDGNEPAPKNPLQAGMEWETQEMSLDSGVTQVFDIHGWKMLKRHYETICKQDLFRSTLFHKDNWQGTLHTVPF